MVDQKYFLNPLNLLVVSKIYSIIIVLDSKQDYVWIEITVNFYSWVKDHKPMRILLAAVFKQE